MSDIILQALQAYGLKSRGRGEYRCKSPFRDDSDTDSFTYNALKGTGHDKVTNQGYNNRQIADHLGIELPDDTGRVPVEDTKRAYRDLADYALTQGVPVDVFEKAGWKLDTHDNRPCFSFPTPNGTRYRFIDGNQKAAKYKSQYGYKECWFGLDRAIAMNKGAIVLCNGEASTIVAQHHGVPAFCKTAGERKIPDVLIDDFVSRGYNGHVWIALDCDATGREQAVDIQEQIPGSVVIDLQLTDKGDLANFCKLYTADSMQALQRLIPTPRPQKPDMVYAHSVAIHAINGIEEAGEGYPLVMPFECIHSLGGAAEIIPPRTIVMILAATGSGKTSFLETCADYWLRRGIGGVWRGDEFSSEGYLHRRIQRYGSLTTRQINSHRMALQEQANNVPMDMRYGKRLSASEIEHYQKVCDWLSEWKGRLSYYEARREKKYVEPMLDMMTAEIQARRKSGEVVAFAVFDYIQLMRTISKPIDDNAHEHAFGLIKEWTIDMDIISLVGSQLTKTAGDDALKNVCPTVNDGQWVRPDKANLILAPRIIYEDDPDGEVDDEGNTRRVPSGRGALSVLKNSEGAKGDGAVIPDLAQLMWVNGRKVRVSFGEE
jgi:hypothetical protein